MYEIEAKVNSVNAWSLGVIKDIDTENEKPFLIGFD